MNNLDSKAHLTPPSKANHGLIVYIDYVLRYVQYPTNIESIKVTASKKHFARVVGLLDTSPDQMRAFNTVSEAKSYFKQLLAR